MPPIYSSVKYKGRPSYDFARKGRSIDLKYRMVNIYNLELISLSSDLLTVKVNCSSGTYIRSLAYEIGNLLGCGASIKGLKRTKINNFKLDRDSFSYIFLWISEGDRLNFNSSLTTLCTA